MKWRSFPLALCGALAVGNYAHAASVALVNPDFEATVPYNNYSPFVGNWAAGYTAPGWYSQGSSTGVTAPNYSDDPGYLFPISFQDTTDTQVAWVTNGYLAQLVHLLPEAGYAYTFSADLVGRRYIGPMSGYLDIFFDPVAADSNVGGFLLGRQAFTINEGDLQRQSVTILGDNWLQYALTGGSIGISFFVPDGHVHFDNASFDVVAPVPLPAAAWLFGTVLAGAGMIGWRKKKA